MAAAEGRALLVVADQRVVGEQSPQPVHLGGDRCRPCLRVKEQQVLIGQSEQLACPLRPQQLESFAGQLQA